MGLIDVLKRKPALDHAHARERFAAMGAEHARITRERDDRIKALERELGDARRRADREVADLERSAADAWTRRADALLAELAPALEPLALAFTDQPSRSATRAIVDAFRVLDERSRLELGSPLQTAHLGFAFARALGRDPRTLNPPSVHAIMAAAFNASGAFALGLAESEAALRSLEAACEAATAGDLPEEVLAIFASPCIARALPQELRLEAVPSARAALEERDTAAFFAGQQANIVRRGEARILGGSGS